MSLPAEGIHVAGSADVGLAGVRLREPSAGNCNAMRLRGHKYGAKACVVDGIRFASQREAKRYGELKLLEKAGEINALCLQPEYPLSVATDDPEAPKQVAVYRGDFEYCDARTGRHVIEDVKGVRTPVYRLKKKMFEAQYGVEIREI